MLKHSLTCIAACAVALPVWAMGEAVKQTDTDGDGVLSVGEVQAAWPDVTLDQFSELDTNNDGVLDAEKVAAAEESGAFMIKEEG